MKKILITLASIVVAVASVWAVMFYLPATSASWLAWRAGWNNLNSSSKPTNSSGCHTTGCSGEICSDSNVVTTCIYKQEFACYKKAKCERHKDGQCAWTLTQDLLQCLGGKL